MSKGIGIYFEHPTWFEPLFSALDRAGLSMKRSTQRHIHMIPEASPVCDLFFNRMSASAYLRGTRLGNLLHTRILATSNGRRPRHKWLRGVSDRDIQALHFHFLDLWSEGSKTRVINSIKEYGAIEGLDFPLIVKPNIGGRGAGIVKFDFAGRIEGSD
jgi:hypothetical protein